MGRKKKKIILKIQQPKRKFGFPPQMKNATAAGSHELSKREKNRKNRKKIKRELDCR